jgi:hypothetical protein
MARPPTRAEYLCRGGRGLVDDGPVYYPTTPATPMTKAIDAEPKSGFVWIADWMTRFLTREPAPLTKFKKLDIRAENGRLVFYRTYVVYDPSDNAGFWFTIKTRGEGDQPVTVSYAYKSTERGGNSIPLRYETRLIRDWRGRVTRYDTYIPGPNGEPKRCESLSVSQVERGVTPKKATRGTGPLKTPKRMVRR